MIVTGIHQIELTNFCNLQCAYCIHGTQGAMKRPMVFMSRDTWKQSLDLVAHYVKQGTQGDLNLAGIGESLLHAGFAGMLGEAREVIGPDRNIDLATNGTKVTPGLIEAIKPFKPRIWVSMHNAAQAAKAIQLLGPTGMLMAVSADGAVAPNDWAGQVEWIKPSYRLECGWLTHGWGFVAATGEILTCCLDASRRSQVGQVGREPKQDLEVEPWELCKTCYQEPGLK